MFASGETPEGPLTRWFTVPTGDGFELAFGEASQIAVPALRVWSRLISETISGRSDRLLP